MCNVYCIYFADPTNHLLYMIDAGKATMEVMDLRTHIREIMLKNITDDDLGVV